MNKQIFQVLVVSIFIISSASVSADPPPWAPAWGYRAKKGHAPKHDYYDYHYRTYYDEDPRYYDQVNRSILSGTCNRELIGSVIGGAAGGYIGSTIGKGDGNLAATAAGALIGFIIGQNVGRSMDQTDVRCTGYALEAAPDNHHVTWNNPDTGSEYDVMPTRTYINEDRYCREYTTTTTINGKSEKVYGTACRNPDGSWQIAD